MRICLVGKENFNQTLTEAIKSRFLDIFTCNSATKILEMIQQQQKAWELIFLDYSLADFSVDALLCLLQHSLPASQVMILRLEDIHKQYEVICEKIRSIKLFDQDSLRRVATAKSIKFRQMVLNQEKRRILVNDRYVNLRQKECQLLRFFFNFPGQVLSKESLLEAIWGHKYCYYSKTLSTHIHQLRSKIGKEFLNIKALPGQGYILL